MTCRVAESQLAQTVLVPIVRPFISLCRTSAVFAFAPFHTIPCSARRFEWMGGVCVSLFPFRIFDFPAIALFPSVSPSLVFMLWVTQPVHVFLWVSRIFYLFTFNFSMFFLPFRLCIVIRNSACRFFELQEKSAVFAFKQKLQSSAFSLVAQNDSAESRRNIIKIGFLIRVKWKIFHLKHDIKFSHASLIECFYENQLFLLSKTPKRFVHTSQFPSCASASSCLASAPCF